LTFFFLKGIDNFQTEKTTTWHYLLFALLDVKLYPEKIQYVCTCLQNGMVDAEFPDIPNFLNFCLLKSARLIFLLQKNGERSQIKLSGTVLLFKMVINNLADGFKFF